MPYILTQGWAGRILSRWVSLRIKYTSHDLDIAFVTEEYGDFKVGHLKYVCIFPLFTFSCRKPRLTLNSLYIGKYLIPLLLSLRSWGHRCSPALPVLMYTVFKTPFHTLKTHLTLCLFHFGIHYEHTKPYTPR